MQIYLERQGNTTYRQIQWTHVEQLGFKDFGHKQYSHLVQVKASNRLRSDQLESENGHNHALRIINIERQHKQDINTLNINIMKVALALNQLQVCTCAKSSNPNYSKEHTMLTYYITTILMHVDTQDKSLSTPSYLSMA